MTIFLNKNCFPLPLNPPFFPPFSPPQTPPLYPPNYPPVSPTPFINKNTSYFYCALAQFVEKGLTFLRIHALNRIIMDSLNFKVLKNGYENNIVAPAKGDAGWDLIAASDPVITYSNDKNSVLYIEYDTGVVIQPPESFFTLLFPRSSISKYTLSFANSVGVIDAGYRNSIKVRFRLTDGKKITKNSILYKKGDKIAQVIFTPMFNLLAHQTESLEGSERGLAGFGERTGS